MRLSCLAQVKEQAADIRFLQSIEKPFGHERVRADFAAFDLIFRYGHRCGRSGYLQSHAGGVFRTDDSGLKRPVLQRDIHKLVVLSDHRVGIDDVLQQVLNIRIAAS